MSFSADLRARTAEAHAQAEATPFLVALAQGRVTVDEVAGLLQRLLPVYEALEDAADRWRDDPHVGPLLVPGLERTAALRQDLVELPTQPTSPASEAYAARARAATTAPAFVAHHYVRYLGDLSGGQVVAAALRSSCGLELAFLSFPGLRGPAVKRAYREQLDRLPWTAQQQDEAVAEAVRAFAENRALAEELG